LPPLAVDWDSSYPEAKSEIQKITDHYIQDGVAEDLVGGRLEPGLWLQVHWKSLRRSLGQLAASIWIPCSQTTSLSITLVSIATLILGALGRFLLEVMSLCSTLPE
jgi:hypothetical protein